MKCHLILISLILLQLCPACLSEYNSPVEKTVPIITGNKQTDFIASGKHQSNRQEESSNTQCLEIGSQISFFSKGGIEADNQILTFNGTTWDGVLGSDWIPGQTSASVTAYYPPMTHEFYQNDGSLTDWLYQKQVFPKSNLLELTFSHLFSQISFHIQENLNKQIDKIKFTPSVRVSDIDALSAGITFSENAPTLCFNQRADCIYTFIVPPSNAMSINIEMQCTTGKTYQTLLTTSNFKQGIHYNCQILFDDGDAGIKTAEDFIAFSHLINGNTYEGRELKEFCTSTDGRTIYQLKNDIHFTEEESARLLPIGNPLGVKFYFEDIFEGNNHELSGITLNQKREFMGIFGFVGKSGIIRNLSIKEITYDLTEKTIGQAGFLCGKSQGEINNCHVDSCTIIHINKEQSFGALSGINTGNVINCSVQNIKASVPAEIGGLINSSSGLIANSYVAACTYSTKNNVGGICKKLYNKGKLYNCYIQGKAQRNVKALVYSADKNTEIKNCYYPEGMKSDGISSQIKENVKSYTSETAYLIPQELNNWIKTEGANLYPSFQFNAWQEGGEIPAIFVVSSKE